MDKVLNKMKVATEEADQLLTSACTETLMDVY